MLALIADFGLPNLALNVITLGVGGCAVLLAILTTPRRAEIKRSQETAAVYKESAEAQQKRADSLERALELERADLVAMRAMAAAADARYQELEKHFEQLQQYAAPEAFERLTEMIATQTKTLEAIADRLAAAGVLRPE